MTTCAEYLSIADVRAEFGSDVDDLTDAQIQRKIDRLVSIAEDALGHTFGRAIVARSSVAENVAVSATALTVGVGSYTFAAYPTLGELVMAANAAGGTYSLELLPQIDPATPSDLLAVRSASACGPDFEDRAVLCLSALYIKAHGDASSYVFLPLPLSLVTEVLENGTEVESTGYWSRAGENWIIKKLCGCATASSCYHPRGRWSNSYPGNIEITFIPQWFGRVPASITAALLAAFEGQTNLGPIQSESFGEYSYSRAGRKALSAEEILGGSTLRQYAIRFQP